MKISIQLRCGENKLNLIKSENIRKCINPLFFFVIALLIIFSLNIKEKAYIDITEFFSRFNHYILPFAIVLGIIFVFLNRKTINNIIENDRINHINEQVKNKEFSKNHPKLNQIPVIKILAKFIYNHGWIYSIAFFPLSSSHFFSFI